MKNEHEKQVDATYWVREDDLKIVCDCEDCRSGETALQRQLNHPFYKDAEAFRNEIKIETLKKAAQKYPEPFNPGSWSIEQLAKHAMAENYDQQNYIYGMYERLQELEKDNIATHKENEELQKQVEFLKNEAEFWRLRCIKKSSEDGKGQFIDKRV